MRGEYGAALRHLGDALELQARTGVVGSKGSLLLTKASIFIDLGEYGRAQTTLRQVMVIYEKQHDRANINVARRQLAVDIVHSQFSAQQSSSQVGEFENPRRRRSTRHVSRAAIRWTDRAIAEL